MSQVDIPVENTSGVDLAGFVRPASVRLVGRFDRGDKPLVKMARYLRQHGFTGPVEVVTDRRDDALAGHLSVIATDLVTSPAAELAVVAVRAPLVAETIDQLGSAGHRRAVILSSGFGESGGADLEAEVLVAARRWGMRVVGPNCQGIWSRVDGFAGSFSDYLEAASSERDGRTAVVSQSGAVAYSLASLLDRTGNPAAMVISTGNEADLDWAELTAHAISHPQVDTVLAYLEQIESIDQLRRANDAVLAAGGRFALLKGGRTQLGTKAAASHTAALASNGAVLEHICRDLGIDLARDLHELVAVASLPPAADRRRVAVLSTSGGTGVVAADLLGDERITVPEFSLATRQALDGLLGPTAATANPVDVTAAAATDPGLIPRAWGLLMDSGEVDVVLVIITMVTGAKLEETVTGLTRAMAARPDAAAPMVVLFAPPPLRGTAGELLREAAIVTFDTLASAVSALATPRLGDPRPAAELASSATPHEGGPTAEVLTDVALLADFAALGLPVVPRAEVPAESLPGPDIGPGPFVLKLITDDLHKAAAGNIDVGPIVRDDLAAAAGRLIGDRFGDHPPRVQVQRYLHAALEVFVGFHRDRTFGAVATIGLGGRLAEPLKAVRHWTLPIAPDDLARGLRATLLGELLDTLPGDATGELVRVVSALAGYFLDRPGLTELDVNPVLFDVRGEPWLIDAAGLEIASEGKN
ncbi:acetate--CoA ligase family protein [Prauserella flavalba]|uniref:acetate--CoA ligase family protein n=1 Tax=Prauserella flavalba TaxID=1477506 RepID=UPI0036EC992C